MKGLSPGKAVEIVKLHPDGAEAWRYEAVATAEQCPGSWFAAAAPWRLPPLLVHGLAFEPDDTLIEYFSANDWYNAFRVESPTGEIRGWYGNVTYPARVECQGGRTSLTWHDLYLDVVRLPDGRVALCDEDELEESGLLEREPALHARIVEAAKQMVALAEAGSFPFHDRDLTA